jgi:hypothetical protein
MWQRLIVGFLLAISAFFVMKYFSPETFMNMNFMAVNQKYENAPMIREPLPRGDMAVSSGGPNPPNVAAPSMMPDSVSPPPEANDPYEETQKTAYAPEELRNPERSFGPGIVPEQTAIATSSGIAGSVAESSQAFQHFGPELVSNGGNFFGSVSALEEENPNYSSF